MTPGDLEPLLGALSHLKRGFEQAVSRGSEILPAVGLPLKLGPFLSAKPSPSRYL